MKYENWFKDEIENKNKKKNIKRQRKGKKDGTYVANKRTTFKERAILLKQKTKSEWAVLFTRLSYKLILLMFVTTLVLAVLYTLYPLQFSGQIDSPYEIASIVILYLSPVVGGWALMDFFRLSRPTKFRSFGKQQMIYLSTSFATAALMFFIALPGAYVMTEYSAIGTIKESEPMLIMFTTIFFWFNLMLIAVIFISILMIVIFGSNVRRVLYVGAFEVVTESDKNIILRAQQLFDDVTVLVVNPTIDDVPTLDKRFENVENKLSSMGVKFDKLRAGQVIDYAIKKGIQIEVRKMSSLDEFNLINKLNSSNKSKEINFEVLGFFPESSKIINDREKNEVEMKQKQLEKEEQLSTAKGEKMSIFSKLFGKKNKVVTTTEVKEEVKVEAEVVAVEEVAPVIEESVVEVVEEATPEVVEEATPEVVEEVVEEVLETAEINSADDSIRDEEENPGNEDSVASFENETNEPFQDNAIVASEEVVVEDVQTPEVEAPEANYNDEAMNEESSNEDTDSLSDDTSNSNEF